MDSENSPKLFRAMVYRNLHKNCWSVRNRATGRVEYHEYSLVLFDECVLRVSQSGRARVLAERKKNVHAMIHGTFYSEASPNVTSEWVQVTYNPYRYETFVRKDTEEPVHKANRVAFLADGRVFALDPK